MEIPLLGRQFPSPKMGLSAYLHRMFKAFDFCNPTPGTKVPHAPHWLHEIKYDGYRLRVERNGDRVRLITRNGYDWTGRYPWIVESALKNRTSSSSSTARRSCSVSTA